MSQDRDPLRAWPCVGGPLDGQSRAWPQDQFYAADLEIKPARLCSIGAVPQPATFRRVLYVLRATTRDRFIWVPA